MVATLERPTVEVVWLQGALMPTVEVELPMQAAPEAGDAGVVSERELDSAMDAYLASRRSERQTLPHVPMDDLSVDAELFG